MLKYNVHVKGLVPILFNKYPEEGTIKSRPTKARPTADEEVENSLYRLENGKIYHPAEHLVGAIVKAGTTFTMKGKTSFKDAMKGGVFVEPMKIEHVIQDYVMDSRPVVIQRARVMKHRARLEQWELKFTLICVDERVIDEDMRAIVAYAGQFIGIGDYRPRYGRFEVVSMDLIKWGAHSINA